MKKFFPILALKQPNSEECILGLFDKDSFAEIFQ